MIPGGLDLLAYNMGRTAAFRHRSTDMINRTTKYTASDGTEHDSPQAAARASLRQAMVDIAVDEGMGDEILRAAVFYADYPEALRDAVNAYFEDLEAHPDVSSLPACDWDPVDALKDVTLTAPPHPSGLILTDKARGMTPNNPHATVYDRLAQGWDQDEMIKHGFAVSTLEEGEIAPGVRGFEMVAPPGVVVPGGTAVSFTPPPIGDPNDPTTWRADLPVDHPQYCRPFGTRED